jgi:YggT family protein
VTAFLGHPLSASSRGACAGRGEALHLAQTGILRMLSFIWLVDAIFNLVWWLILASVIMSWLFAFNIVNVQNPTVRQIANGLSRLTEPLLAPIRRILPNLGGLDLSPIVLLLGLEFLRRFVIEMMISAAR